MTRSTFLASSALVERHGRRRHQGGLGRLDGDARRLERFSHLLDAPRVAGDAPRTSVVGHVVGPGLERGFHDVVLCRAHPAPAPRLCGSNCHDTEPGSASRAAHLGEDVAHLGAGAVPVVGEHVDQHGHAAGRVALVGDRLVGDALELAGAPLDGPLDGVDGHGRGAGLACTWCAAWRWPRGHRRPPGRPPRPGG